MAREVNPSWSLQQALSETFEEFNCFGFAQQSAQFRLAEREIYGIKELHLHKMT